MPIPNLFDLTDIGATLSGLKNKSAFLPRVARGASQPWAGRRNAFGIKNDLKCQKGPTVAEEVDMKCNIFDKVDVRSSAEGLHINLKNKADSSTSCCLYLRRSNGHKS